MISACRGHSSDNAQPLRAGAGEDVVEEWEALGHPVEDQRRAVAILQAGGMDLNAEHEAKRVGDELTLAALNPLSGDISNCSAA